MSDESSNINLELMLEAMNIEYSPVEEYSKLSNLLTKLSSFDIFLDKNDTILQECFIVNKRYKRLFIDKIFKYDVFFKEIICELSKAFDIMFEKISTSANNHTENKLLALVFAKSLFEVIFDSVELSECLFYQYQTIPEIEFYSIFDLVKLFEHFHKKNKNDLAFTLVKCQRIFTKLDLMVDAVKTQDFNSEDTVLNINIFKILLSEFQKEMSSMHLENRVFCLSAVARQILSSAFFLLRNNPNMYSNFLTIAHSSGSGIQEAQGQWASDESARARPSVDDITDQLENF